MRFWLTALTSAAALCASSSLNAATYVGNHTIGDGTISLSVTTDDTLGVLTQANITDWSFLFSSPAGSASLDTSNALFSFFSGTALSATVTELIFDFNGTGHIQWDNFGLGGNDAYCMDTVGAAFSCILAAPSEAINVNGVISSEARSGRFILGTLAAVPEPSTWAMMLFGFGAVGYSMRRRRKLVLAQVV